MQSKFPGGSGRESGSAKVAPTRKRQRNGENLPIRNILMRWSLTGKWSYFDEVICFLETISVPKMFRFSKCFLLSKQPLPRKTIILETFPLLCLLIFQGIKKYVQNKTTTVTENFPSIVFPPHKRVELLDFPPILLNVVFITFAGPCRKSWSKSATLLGWVSESPPKSAHH